MKTIYLAGGCFWGVEHFFSLIKGIVNTKVGYANSNIDKPSYEDLKTHISSAAECVKVDYDETIISLEEILDLFFKIIDPTILDRQGNDVGHQYRTGIYYELGEDKTIIENKIKEIASNYDKEIVTEVLKLDNYYLAEDYHQEYLYKNPNGYCHIGKEYFELAKNYRK